MILIKSSVETGLVHKYSQDARTMLGANNVEFIYYSLIY